MMGSCTALLQPVASLRVSFSPAGSHGAPSLGLVFGGIVGVLIATYVVKSLPLIALRWLVIVVIAYAAFAMLRSGFEETQAGDLETWRLHCARRTSPTSRKSRR